HRTRRDRESRRVDGNAARAAGASTAAQRYFAALCFFLASARRSVFFRRLARFLTLSLPWLCPISSKTQPLAPSRHVVVFQRRPKVIAGLVVTSDETEADVCVRLRRTAFHAISAPAHPEL